MGIEKLSVALLMKYEGKGIADICDNGLTNDDDNHCAHFVNHVLSHDFGYSCGKATGKKNASANVRVHETFGRCPQVGKWEDVDSKKIKKCFAFITYGNSVKLAQKKMANRPKKHVGIYCDGNIWHYSNTKDKVVKQTPVEFAKHYKGSQFSMFYGSFPTDLVPVEYS
jgi:hypothetical protein